MTALNGSYRCTKAIIVILCVFVASYITNLNVVVQRNAARLINISATVNQNRTTFPYSTRPRIPEYNEWKLSNSSVNSVTGTTGPGVPGAIKDFLLQETGKEIVENADDFYGSEEAVQEMEAKCGWNPETSNFDQESCLDSIEFKDTNEEFPVDPSLIDIVTPSIRNLDFLDQWREFFQGFHIIIIQDGDPSVKLEIPEWVDFELYNRNDIEDALGDDQWIISSKDASIRNFGFLVSKKPYIYTIDDDCLPAKDDDGFFINPIAVHLNNLQAPSNPYFFNTLYDPYHSAADFVRGYPYSLRDGVPTAISHGLWLNAPDYDAPTQLLKPRERNTNFLDMAMTIPVNTFYPMCSMNVAFSRELIGPAFMQGLMGEGQPWARYDDMFAGWASKVVADHLGFGVKSGMPYIYHNKASNPFTNLKKEFKGLWWQEEIIRFFINEVTFPSDVDTAAIAYIHLAQQIETRFSDMHPYFSRLATAMIIWAETWIKVELGETTFTPSRVSDDDVVTRYKVLNVGHRSWFRDSIWSHDTSPPREFREIMSYWSPTDSSKKFVTPQDVQIGHKWKTYMYPLPSKFHKDVFERFQIPEGCILDICSEETFQQNSVLQHEQYTDYIAEAVILRKLVSSLDFVLDPNEADLILVPALCVTVSHYYEDGSYRTCRNGEPCATEWFDELFSVLSEFNKGEEGGKTHLFLSTQDFNQNHQSIYDLGGRSDAIVVNLGPGGLVVPSLDTIPFRQPSHWGGGIPYEDRTIFVLANFGVRDWLTDRIVVSEQLDNYQGNKTIVRVAPDNLGHDVPSSVFVLCLPGDLPYQKRIFDTWASVSIPVVISRVLDDGRKSYWHETFFMSGMSPVETSFPDFGGVDFSDIVVEVPRNILDEPGGLMEYLEGIPELEIRRKLQRIERMRTYFLYDLEGNRPDAFTMMLTKLSQMLGKE